MIIAQLAATNRRDITKLSHSCTMSGLDSAHTTTSTSVTPPFFVSHLPQSDCSSHVVPSSTKLVT